MPKRQSASDLKKLSGLFQAESFLLSGLCGQGGTPDQHTLFSSPHLLNETESFVAIDEVGRGCVAGPVVVCATLWTRGEVHPAFQSWLGSLRDSKKMSALARNTAFEDALEASFIQHQPVWELLPSESRLAGLPQIARSELKEPIAKRIWKAEHLLAELNAASQKDTLNSSYMLSSVGIGHATAAEIDEHGIIPALSFAASRSLSKISGSSQPSVIFFDGHRALALTEPWASKPQILVTKGDDLLKSISASSVVAKVIRDRWMEKYSQIYPAYGFDEHRGYGTAKHQNLLVKNGFSPIHRRTFLKNICPELFR